MHLQKIIPFLIAIVIALTACSNAEMEEKGMQEYISSADSMTSSSAAEIADLNSQSRKVIHKADVKCRVVNVQQAVKQLEQFTIAAGGFVQESHTENNIISEKSATYKTDSLKTIQLYETTASMVIRIPYFALDTLADQISNIAAFVHHRDMQRQDVTLQYLSNMLKNRETSDSQPQPVRGNTGQATTAVQSETHRQVDRCIANLSILDDTRYATLSLQLYQPAQATEFTTRNTDKMLTPSFGKRMSDALHTSVDIILSFIVGVVAIWPVWAALLAILVLYRAKRRRRTPVVHS